MSVRRERDTFSLSSSHRDALSCLKALGSALVLFYQHAEATSPGCGSGWTADVQRSGLWHQRQCSHPESVVQTKALWSCPNKDYWSQQETDCDSYMTTTQCSDTCDSKVEWSDEHIISPEEAQTETHLLLSVMLHLPETRRSPVDRTVIVKFQSGLSESNLQPQPDSHLLQWR